MYGTGFFPTDAVNIYAIEARRALPRRDVRGPAAGLPHGRDPRRGRAAAPVRRLLAVLPPRGRRRGQGHARDVPRPPVRQGRDVRLRAPEGRGTSTSGCSRSGGARRRSSSCRTAWSTSPPATSARRRRRSTTSRSGSRRSSATARSTSASNTTDFQARRLGIRYRDGKGLEPVHTLNGTAVDRPHGCSRCSRTSSGDVPEVLRQYGAPERVNP